MSKNALDPTVKSGILSHKDIISFDNSITEQHIKEGLSIAFVTALAHFSGLNLSDFNFDYGLDGSFSGIKVKNNRYASNGFYLDFQLKASTNIEICNDYIKYNLESKTYNDLVDTEVGSPRILILYKLPKDKNLWFNITESGITLCDCAWWHSFAGNSPTSNTSKISVRIPRTQLLTPIALRSLMQKVERGDDL